MSHKPPFRYFGSKWSIAPWIVSHLPEHACYVEVFGGSAAVLLSKPVSEHEVYNDLHSEVVRFFRVLRDRPDELARAIQLTPWSREEHAASFEEANDDLEAARRFYTRAWQTRGGYRRSGRSSWQYCITARNWSRPPARWKRYVDGFAAIAERMSCCYIERLDWREVLVRYDAPSTCFYLDPPYLKHLRRASWEYEHEFGADDHAELLERVVELQGHVLLSGYHSNEYDDALDGWRRAETTTHIQTGGLRTEVLWMSPGCRPAQGDLFAIERCAP